MIGLVIYFGQKLNWAVLQRVPDTAIPFHITPAGTVLWAGVVSFWLICLVAAKLGPDSTLGTFSGSVAGASVVFAGPIIVAAVAATILESIGYPIATRDEKS